MTKVEFQKLLRQTKRHWENDILKAPAKVFKDISPIRGSNCDVCKFFNNVCSECFLKELDDHCLSAVCDANCVIEEYKFGRCSIRDVRKSCRIAYKAILQRFAQYRKDNFV